MTNSLVPHRSRSASATCFTGAAGTLAQQSRVNSFFLKPRLSTARSLVGSTGLCSKAKPREIATRVVEARHEARSDRVGTGLKDKRDSLCRGLKGQRRRGAAENDDDAILPASHLGRERESARSTCPSAQ
jgi:hypothetical protein